MKNKILLFFFAAVCFATTFANNKPPGQKISYLSSVTSTSMTMTSPVEQTVINAMMISQTNLGCEIINNKVAMIDYRALGLHQGQLCLPASNRFGVMLQINKMMCKDRATLGYTSRVDYSGVMSYSFNLNRGLVLKCPMNNSLSA